MTTYGIGHTNAINSCWYVVDAINKHPAFAITYPDDHDAQHCLADGFAKWQVLIFSAAKVPLMESFFFS
jgi:hypothetical protein